MLVYVWSRRNPLIRMNFFGLLNFQVILINFFMDVVYYFPSIIITVSIIIVIIVIILIIIIHGSMDGLPEAGGRDYMLQRCI